MAIEIYTPLLLSYPITSTTITTSKVSTRHHALSINERCQHLMELLAKSLTQFYPSAGRIVKGNSIVKCNDDGAAFIKAQISCCLLDILENPDGQILKPILPIEIESKEAQAGCFLYKLICLSVVEWQLALGSSDSDQVLNLPEFGAASRYVFDASKNATLRSELASSVVPKPTCVEVVSALIWKSATKASRSNLGKQRPSFFYQDVNLRKRVVPPLPENLARNVVGSFISKADEESSKNMLQNLSLILTRHGNKHNKRKNNDEMEIYSCTRWRRKTLFETNKELLAYASPDPRIVL
ncbi:BAHD acyltransferase [Pyrus ussuriensis x Pyrus communis]|uniref:BAHD acyltransferase n=1 Tax=Pyrus ussuriensis x Pyrus communis TaxID=2448454 RepID=A0A5N5FG69_9ROSA|nr:BAHD acyltransferase [Pyrus ussuriensis x Pyrus communis]